MKELDSKTKKLSKNYIQKYDHLIKMMNGYEKYGKGNDVSELKGLTSKIKSIIDKTLISEGDFLKLKKE